VWTEEEEEKKKEEAEEEKQEEEEEEEMVNRHETQTQKLTQALTHTQTRYFTQTHRKYPPPCEKTPPHTHLHVIKGSRRVN
jgi:hypothetical protein